MRELEDVKSQLQSLHEKDRAHNASKSPDRRKEARNSGNSKDKKSSSSKGNKKKKERQRKQAEKARKKVGW